MIGLDYFVWNECLYILHFIQYTMQKSIFSHFIFWFQSPVKHDLRTQLIFVTPTKLKKQKRVDSPYTIEMSTRWDLWLRPFETILDIENYIFECAYCNKSTILMCEIPYCSKLKWNLGISLIPVQMFENYNNDM